MILQINEDYRIASDPCNFKLQRKKGNRWITLGYYMTIEPVLKRVRDEKIRLLGKHSPDKFLRLLHALTRDIQAIGKKCIDMWGRE